MEVIEVDLVGDAVPVTESLEGLVHQWPTGRTLLVVHNRHKHSQRSAQWKEISKSLNGPNRIICASHNSLVGKHRDAFAPLEFGPDSALNARGHEVLALAKARLHDVWFDVHCLDLVNTREKGDSQAMV